MKLAKLITVAVLGVSFLGATAVMASPARPNGGKTSVKAGHHKKHHGKKHGKAHTKRTGKKHHKSSKPA